MDWRTRLEALSCQLGPGAALADIDAVETTLSIKLPDTYRQFLQHVGWASIEDMLILYGLGADCPPEYNLLALAMQAREEGLPPEFLAIAEDNVMGLIFLRVHDNPMRVVSLDEQANEEELSDDFEDWLDGEICDFEDEDLDED